MRIRIKALLFFGCLCLLTISVHAQYRSQDQKRAHFVDSLLDKMTLKEKIGQLNLLSSGMAVTGPTISKNTLADIKAGKVGGIFNAYTPEFTRKLQKAAV